MEFGAVTRNIWVFRCYGPDGKLKWEDGFENLTTTEGRNDALTQYLKGSSYTATHFVGLINNSGFTAIAVGDTAGQINGTNQWTELTDYSQSTRPALTLGTASAGSISNVASLATFSINNTVTVNGGFTVTNSTKAGTSGKIYGEGSFSSPRSFVSGDTLTVQVTLTLASA
jgi:hypothetical protein